MNPWKTWLVLNVFADEVEKKRDRQDRKSGQHKKRLVVFSEILSFFTFAYLSIAHNTEEQNEKA